MHDHRLPRHDRPPETWLPHPGTPEPSPPPPMSLSGDAWPTPPQPAPWRGGVATGVPTLAPNASPFARFIVGLVSGRKSIPLAAALGLLGPLGLFYVSFLNGVAALVVVPYLARSMGFAITQAIGGGPDTVVSVAIVVCWLISVPWAVVAARRRNARLGL